MLVFYFLTSVFTAHLVYIVTRFPILGLLTMSYWCTVMDSKTKVQHGKRLVPVVIDEIAANDPNRVCFSFPRSIDLKDGFRDVNFHTVGIFPEENYEKY